MIPHRTARLRRTHLRHVATPGRGTTGRGRRGLSAGGAGRGRGAATRRTKLHGLPKNHEQPYTGHVLPVSCRTIRSTYERIKREESEDQRVPVGALGGSWWYRARRRETVVCLSTAIVMCCARRGRVQEREEGVANSLRPCLRFPSGPHERSHPGCSEGFPSTCLHQRPSSLSRSLSRRGPRRVARGAPCLAIRAPPLPNTKKQTNSRWWLGA
jgi:hypothetical protein